MTRLGRPGLRRLLWALGAAGVLTGVGVSALALDSRHVPDPWINAVLGCFIGWSFIGIGIYAWWRRASSRFGALMVAVGFAWFVALLAASNDPVVFTIGVAFSNLYFVMCGHMLLAFPDGRLKSRLERRLIASGYAVGLLSPLPLLLFAPDFTSRGCDCPESAIKVADQPQASNAVDVASSVMGIVILGAIAAILVGRWRRSPASQRPALAPVVWSGVALVTTYVLLLSADVLRLPGPTQAFNLVGIVAFAVVPYAFLLGILRSRFSRAGAISTLLAALRDEVGSGDLRDLLARALGEPGLELAYRLDGPPRTVDDQGHPIELPAPGDPERTATDVELEGVRVGAIIHDRALCDEPELLQTVAAAAGLAMENGRLQAELHARVDELQASRARLVEAGVAERRRLERDLHDGAQQRLVALSLTLRLAQARLTSDPEAAEGLLDGAQAELALALAELRELARGIHPAVLSDRGLEAALEALASRSPVPVTLEGSAAARLPEPIEAAVYFVVSEGLTNVAKYAHATRAVVRVDRVGGDAVVELSDDGIGGADPVRGTGLSGLRDRIGALDGRLVIDSPPGRGTRLRAEIPCGSMSSADPVASK